jgi:GNAT superfamily N-acetyltransferase
MRIREATIHDAGAIARVNVDCWRTSYAGIVPAAHLAGLSYEQRAENWRRYREPGRYTYVAEDSRAGIVAFASGGPERSGDVVYRGEIYALYVLPAYHRQGIGRQLIAAVTRRLLADGLTTLLIWVLADNPARAFYARLGGSPVRQQMINIGGADLAEIGYGWLDAKALAAPSED